jgi:hypothetical protein
MAGPVLVPQPVATSPSPGSRGPGEPVPGQTHAGPATTGDQPVRRAEMTGTPHKGQRQSPVQTPDT